MEFQDVVRRRRMVRSFRPDPVPDHVVRRMLDNALRAPSAGFTQGWAFLVLRGAEETARFWEATFPDGRETFAWPGLFAAPLIIVALSHEQAYLDRYAEADKGMTEPDPDFWPVPYWHIDTGFAALLILLTAVDAGLGGLFFGVFGERMNRLRDAFAVPPEYTPIGAIALGYPAGDDRPSASLRRGRRPVHEVVHWGRFSSTGQHSPNSECADAQEQEATRPPPPRSRQPGLGGRGPRSGRPLRPRFSS
jgi:nitroreductase